MTNIGYWYPLDAAGQPIEAEMRQRLGVTHFRYFQNEEDEEETAIFFDAPDDGETYLVYVVTPEESAEALAHWASECQRIDRKKRVWGWALHEATPERQAAYEELMQAKADAEAAREVKRNG